MWRPPSWRGVAAVAVTMTTPVLHRPDSTGPPRQWRRIRIGLGWWGGRNVRSGSWNQWEEPWWGAYTQLQSNESKEELVCDIAVHKMDKKYVFHLPAHGNHELLDGWASGSKPHKPSYCIHFFYRGVRFLSLLTVQAIRELLPAPASPNTTRGLEELTSKYDWIDLDCPEASWWRKPCSNL